MQSREEIKALVGEICEALISEKYDPTAQLSGYILSEDPAYITTRNGARSKITRIDRDVLLQCMLSEYLAEVERQYMTDGKEEQLVTGL